MEGPTTSSQRDPAETSSNVDRPAPPAEEMAASLLSLAADPLISSAGQVGFYDMTSGAGQAYQIPPIITAGGSPINIADPNAAALANLDVLWVNNPSNGDYGAEYLSRRSDIDAAVQNGMVLVIHDRFVTNAAAMLPGGAGFGIFRDFAEGTDINIRDSSTPVTDGVTNTNLDGGNFSDHGFASANTLPPDAKLILTSTSNNRIVTFCYPRGRGSVIYSTIPLDFYLASNFPPPALRAIYAPNVVRYALAGACSARNRPPVARCQDVTVNADQTCSAAASVNNGSFDPDGDAITCTEAPTGPYSLGGTTVTLTCTDTGGLSSSCTGVVTVQDTSAPQISCPADQQLECQDGGAIATYTSTATDNCGPVTTSCAPPSGSSFPLGQNAATCTAADGAGNTASCLFSVEVRDTLPPQVTLNPPAVLWPPNHEYHAFDIASCIHSITDQCTGTLSVAGTAQITKVTSDEPDDVGAGGDGNTQNDMVITSATTVNLRAERQGDGDGRVYQVHFTVTDANGNSTQASCPVQVPHDFSGTPAVDSGVASCVGAGC